MQFHLLSFEGPDPYARAGGLASRVEGLSSALAALGFESHLWFVGDPEAPGVEVRGRLVLHRWCQWLSAVCPGGVYDGEDAEWGRREPHGAEVRALARSLGLREVERRASAPGAGGLVAALCEVEAADVVWLEAFVDPAARRTLFRAADTVLANSGHEPFGLVGLEAMAAGGLACTGGSGEDYALAGRNALVLQSSDPREFVGLYRRLRETPAEGAAHPPARPRHRETVRVAPRARARGAAPGGAAPRTQSAGRVASRATILRRYRARHQESNEHPRADRAAVPQ